MPDFEYYRIYLQAGLREAERYLLSNDLFWPLNIVPDAGEPGYPSLTLGGLLFLWACARPLARSGSQKTALKKFETEIDAIRTRWQVAWERKATWEFKSRLRQWGIVLKEIRVDPEENAAYYGYEVRLRVLLNLLGAEIKEVESALQEHLDSLDLLLQALFISGEFIWESDLADGFPVDQYWYLWGELKEP